MFFEAPYWLMTATTAVRMQTTAQALEELYRSRYFAFRGGVAAITGSDETAHDVVQEAFAQALRDQGQFRGDGSLAAWVWRIVFRIALKDRSNGRRRPLSLNELLMAAPGPNAEHDPQITTALRALPARQRLVLFLRYFADLSYAEIGALLEISEGTVGATLSQARAVLLKAISAEEARDER